MNIRNAALSTLFGLTMFAAFQTSAMANGAGSFSGHKNYKVSGGVTVTQSGGKTTVLLSDNFKSSSGPDLYIYVGTGKPTKIIAKLKSFNGAQSYTFSGTSKVTSVHVYCKRYSVGFGTAKLK
ncbi:MAG: hypothetical protein GKR97_00275 [Rhizobiaceae bacterium]|nr:hypothetical protein [Rhizobiaceae bacterium]